MNSNNRSTYDTYIEAIILLLIGVFIWITLAYLCLELYWIIDKVDKVYSILDTNRVNAEIEVGCQ